MLRFILSRLRSIFKSSSLNHDKFPLDPSIPPTLSLPSHLLAAILSRLPAADFIRSGAVCKSWREITAPQIPYLIFPGGKTCNMFSLTDHRVYDMPQIHGKKMLGSSDGWLVYADEMAELHILNPFTGATASLPSITTLSPVKAVERNGRITGYTILGYALTLPQNPEFMRNRYFTKVIYFPSVSIAVAIYHLFWRFLAFARLGDDSWTEFHPNPAHCGLFSDAIFHKSLLFAVRDLGIIHAYDLSSSPPVMRLGGPKTLFRINCEHYLVESLDGVLLHVTKNFPNPNSTKFFEIFTPERVPVTNLGANTALFLGHNHSISLSTRDTPLKGNCIYFTKDYYFKRMGVFDLEDGSMTPLFPNDSPLAHLTSPPPIWIKHGLAATVTTLGLC